MDEIASRRKETERKSFLAACMIGAAVSGFLFLQSLAISSGPVPKLDARIDPNVAGLESLVRLPGIGPSKARSILDFRQGGGWFGCAEDMQNVKGIGPKTVEKLRVYLKFEIANDGSRLRE